MEYTCLTRSYDEALETIRVTKTQKSKRNGKVMENLLNVEQEAADQVRNVVKGLGLGNREFMLAVAWVTEESRLNHKKYPKLLGSDETFRTNAEKRPLARLVGKNMNNNILPFVNSFLPSKQRWVFHWLWGDAYPFLLCKKALLRTTLILVDQDERNWLGMIGNLSPTKNIYGKAKARLCNWHKVRI